jgi:hypothetical protein
MKNFVSVSLLLAASCGPGSGTPYDGIPTEGITFHLYSTDMGIHPSQSVLDDPNNPFAHVAIDDLNNGTPEKPARKWAFNPMTAPPVTCFYVWASTLARAPNGENQFYTAERLYDVYRFDLSSPEDHEAVRVMAIRAFTAILTYFPEDYNRTADGKLEFDYASVALQRIQTLAPGEPLPQGWYLVTDSQGNLRATRI